MRSFQKKLVAVAASAALVAVVGAAWAQSDAGTTPTNNPSNTTGMTDTSLAPATVNSVNDVAVPADATNRNANTATNSSMAPAASSTGNSSTSSTPSTDNSSTSTDNSSDSSTPAPRADRN